MVVSKFNTFSMSSNVVWNMYTSFVQFRKFKELFYLVYHIYAASVKEVGRVYCLLWARTFVRASVSHVFVNSITFESPMLGFWNFIYGFVMKQIVDSYVFLLLFFFFFLFLLKVVPLSWVMALWKQLQWNLVSKISQKLYELLYWNLICL